MSAHILVVEDETLMADFLAAWLNQLGYEVALAYDGLEALAHIHAAAPQLVLVDLMLPSMGGWELVRRIRAEARFQHIPIVVCTARQEAYLPTDLVQGILHKPFPMDEFTEKIREAFLN